MTNLSTLVKTQKARGVVRLREKISLLLPPWLHTLQDVDVLPHSLRLLGRKQGFAGVPDIIPGTLFARPCPQRPRHGFVASRSIDSIADALQVYIEARAADPAAEVLIMPRVDAQWSAIGTASSIVWGKGHDGATAGKGRQFSFPYDPAKTSKLGYNKDKTAYVNRDLTAWDYRWHKWGAGAEIGVQSSHYAEIVYGRAKADSTAKKLRSYVVQLRDGPELLGGAATSHIPSQHYLVRHVVDLPREPDLLAWEAQAAKLPKGSLVVLRFGSLASHAAVHGVQHGHAVMILSKDAPAPVRGDKLSPASTQPAPITPDGYRWMARAAAVLPHMRTFSTSTDMRELLALSIATLHAQPYWGRERHLLAARIAGAQIACQALIAACIAEDRHFYTAGPGNNSSVHSAVDWEQLLAGLPPRDIIPPGSVQRMRGKIRSHERSSIWSHVFGLPLSAQIAYAQAARDDFLRDWGSSEHSIRDIENGSGKGCGYGGFNWASATTIALKLALALSAFLDKPTAKTWAEVVRHYNVTINAAHNNGKVFDKYLDNHMIDVLADCPGFGLLSGTVGELLSSLAAVPKPAPKPRQRTLTPAPAPAPAPTQAPSIILPA